MQPFPLPHDSGTSRDVKFALRQVIEADYDLLFALHRAAMKGYVDVVCCHNGTRSSIHMRIMTESS